MYLALRHAFGVEGCIRDNVAFVTMPDPDADGAGLVLGYLIHPVGQQVCTVRRCPLDPVQYCCANFVVLSVCAGLNLVLIVEHRTHGAHASNLLAGD